MFGDEFTLNNQKLDIGDPMTGFLENDESLIKPHDFSGNPYFKEINHDKECILNKKASTISFQFNNSIQECPIPSDLRISTMTAICSIGINIDLSILYEYVDLSNDSYPFIKSCQFGTDNIKGDFKKKKTKRKKKPMTAKRNYFQNQATLIIVISDTRKVNLKIFRNGKIQMTGLKSKEEGIIVCEKLLEEINRISGINKSIYSDESTKSIISNFSIVLINSDFFGGFKIKRERLYDILFRKNIFVSYEPDIYPGVNAKYYWNELTNGTQYAGICKCKSPCDGKGDGSGDGKCKKVTIATFQSGNVIITGARNNTQTMNAYNFINQVFKDNYKEIVRYNNDNLTLNNRNNKKIKINPNNVVNFSVRELLLNKLENNLDY